MFRSSLIKLWPFLVPLLMIMNFYRSKSGCVLLFVTARDEYLLSPWKNNGTMTVACTMQHGQIRIVPSWRWLALKA
jgi:hypothetical protein